MRQVLESSRFISVCYLNGYPCNLNAMIVQFGRKSTLYLIDSFINKITQQLKPE